VNNNYDSKLQDLVLSKKAVELFNLILDDANVNTHKGEFLQERKLLLKQLEEQEAMLSKARKLFVADQLKFDDFSELKKDYQTLTCSLKKELDTNTTKLRFINQQYILADRPFASIFQDSKIDAADKKQIVSLIPPTAIDFQKGDVSLKLNNALSKILLFKK
jgi:hypothetical protein